MASNCSRVPIIEGSEEWLSILVFPCPGKCLAQAYIPPSCTPLIKAFP